MNNNDNNPQNNTTNNNTQSTQSNSSFSDNTVKKTGTDPNAPKYPGQFWPNPGEPGYDTSLDPNHDDFFVKPLPTELKLQIHEEYYKAFLSLPEEKRKAKINVNYNKELDFDLDYFVWLLGNSISLEDYEKKDILNKLPELSQFQIDELIKIFEEEKYKFMILNVKNNNVFSNYAKNKSSSWKMELEKENFEKQKEEDMQKLQQLSSMLNFSQYKCTKCGWVYDEEIGFLEGGIDGGTLWNEIDENFVCPICKAPKSQFTKID